MSPLSNPLGVCSWSLKPTDPRDLVARVREAGLDAVQLALVPLHREPETWGEAVDQLRAAEVAILSGMFGTIGENYSSLETIARTGGVLPDEHWDDNRTLIDHVAKLAARHEIQTVSFHAGFIPEDESDPRYAKMQERLATIADRFAQDGLDLLLETGQETAEDLDRFLQSLDRPNLGVNFDPANMILYGKGDPVAALRKLLPRVRQVHIKDAQPSDEPGRTWGRETAVGDGAVDWAAFLRVLEEGKYAGPLVIEREGGDQRLADIQRAAEHLRTGAPSQA